MKCSYAMLYGYVSKIQYKNIFSAEIILDYN